jgi:putative peptidoglycan lipid II flippase
MIRTNRETVEPKPAGQSAARRSRVVANTLTGSAWTIISRVTGFARVVAIGAVLGATYLGNTYQGLNGVPNLIYYQLLAGSLFVSVLVPPLVKYAANGEDEAARNLTQGFVGVLLLVGAGAALVLAVCAPLVLHLFSAGVKDPAIASAQQRAGFVLLILFAPQVPLYVLAGTGAAIQNAAGRFALAAGAPTIENLGIMATLAGVVAYYGTTSITNVSTGELIALGLGTTGAVALHALAQVLGARHVGASMRPRVRLWQDAGVRSALAGIRAVVTYTMLAAVQVAAEMVVANRIAGGLVAFQLALGFFYLPTAIFTWPLVRALVPRLAACYHSGREHEAWNELIKATTFALFLVVPTATLYATLGLPLTHVVAIGRLDTAFARSEVAAALIALTPAILGETMFIVATYALYARRDMRSPVRSMAIKLGVTLVGMLAAWQATGATSLALLSAAISVGSLSGAAHIWSHPSIRPALREKGFGRTVRRTGLGAVAMAVPCTLTTVAVPWSSMARPTMTLTVAAAATVGLLAYWCVAAKANGFDRSALSGAVLGRVRGG